MRSARWSKPLESIDQHELRRNDRQALEVDCLDAIIAQILHLEHARVEELCNLAQAPLKRCEKRWVVERPFRSFLKQKPPLSKNSSMSTPRVVYLEVPLFYRQRVGYGQPIPVDLEVCGFAGGQVRAPRRKHRGGSTD